jgi:hypothetical protein
MRLGFGLGLGFLPPKGTGSAAIHNVITAGKGIFQVTGIDAILRIARRLVCGTGSLPLTGQAATIRIGRVIVCGTGSFALTGINANLVKGTPGTITDDDWAAWVAST